MRISRLPRSSVFYLLDRILEEYPEDFEAWLDEYQEGEEMGDNGKIEAVYLGKDEDGKPTFVGLVDVEPFVTSLEPKEMRKIEPGLNPSQFEIVLRGQPVVVVYLDSDISIKLAEEQLNRHIARINESKPGKFSVRLSSDGLFFNQSVPKEMLIELLEQILDMVRCGVHERE